MSHRINPKAILFVFSLMVCLGVLSCSKKRGIDRQPENAKDISSLSSSGFTVTFDESLQDQYVIEIDGSELSGVSDEQMAIIGNCKNLQSLAISGTTNVDCLKQLLRLPKLVSLKIFMSNIDNDGLAVLGQITSLKELQLTYSPKITSAGLRHIALLQLEKLSLHTTNIDDEGVQHLTKIESLKSLNLSFTKITDIGCKTISKLHHLQKLWLDGLNIHDSGIREIVSLKNLRILNLNSTDITDESVHLLSQVSELEELRIAHTNYINGSSLKYLPSLKKLRLLALSSKSLSTGYSYLGCLQSLETLILLDSSITDEEAKFLATLPQLRDLVLGACPAVTSSIFTIFTPAHELELIDISVTSISSEHWDPLLSLSKLKKLYLLNCELDEADIRKANKVKPDLKIYPLNCTIKKR